MKEGCAFPSQALLLCNWRSLKTLKLTKIKRYRAYEKLPRFGYRLFYISIDIRSYLIL